MKKRINNIKVIKNEENPETPEILAASLIKISDAMEKLSVSGGISDEGIATLCANMPGMVGKIRKRDILLVINGLKRLKSYYVRR